MDIRTFEGSKQKAIKWRELNRWIWRGIRTLELDGNYTGGHKLVKIAPKKLPFFKVGKELKDRVDG
jgi:hypothetical protein